MLIYIGAGTGGSGFGGTGIGGFGGSKKTFSFQNYE